jgi:hypothetical protein
VVVVVVVVVVEVAVAVGVDGKIFTTSLAVDRKPVGRAETVEAMVAKRAKVLKNCIVVVKVVENESRRWSN